MGRFEKSLPENLKPFLDLMASPTESGNIDLTNRPMVFNPDGSISTVRSRSFGMDGKEVLLPTVSDDGKNLTDDETKALYKKTGKHLGIFRDPESATGYAQKLHQDQEASLNLMPQKAKPEMQKLDLSQAPASSQATMARELAGPSNETDLKSIMNSLAEGKRKKQEIFDPYSKSQNESADMIQNLALDTLTSKGKVNLQPLLALTDSWSGSKLSQGYNAPETAEDRASKAATLMNMAAQRRGDVAKEQIALLKDNDMNKLLGMQMGMKNSNDRMNRFDTSDLEKLSDKITHDRRYTQAGDKISAANKLLALMDKSGGKLMPQQFNEAGLAAAALLMNGSRVAQETAASVTPRFGKLTAGEIAQEILSKPQDVDVREFLQKLAGMATRERDTSLAEQKGMALAHLPAYYRKHRDNPALYDVLESTGGLSKQEVIDYMENHKRHGGPAVMEFSPVRDGADLSPQGAGGGYSQQQEMGISQVMKDNNIPRQAAVDALIAAGKLK